jgi:hypothetical protein
MKGQNIQSKQEQLLQRMSLILVTNIIIKIEETYGLKYTNDWRARI